MFSTITNSKKFSQQEIKIILEEIKIKEDYYKVQEENNAYLVCHKKPKIELIKDEKIRWRDDIKFLVTEFKSEKSDEAATKKIEYESIITNGISRYHPS